MMFWSIFEKTSGWAKTHLDEDAKKLFYQYLYNVAYHLHYAREAERKCSETLREIEWGYSATRDNEIHLIETRFDEMIWYGDIAVRESASALDATLVFINHVFGLGLQQDRLRWKSNNLRESIRDALVRKFSDPIDLIMAFDKVYNSIGYELMSEYRHWVTHRGAPRLKVDDELKGRGIPIPAEALSRATTPEEKEWDTERYLDQYIPDHLHVYCYPFVPPVNKVLNFTHNDPEKELEVPGIRIGKGVKNLTVRNYQYSIGSLRDNADEYRAINQTLLDKGDITIAGENLAIYSANNYIMAISILVLHFVQIVLMYDLDEAVSKFCASIEMK